MQVASERGRLQASERGGGSTPGQPDGVKWTCEACVGACSGWVVGLGRWVGRGGGEGRVQAQTEPFDYHFGPSWSTGGPRP